MTSPIIAEGILPFLLVFVLVFAILQKSHILGEGKPQIDALVSFAIAAMAIIVPAARNFIVTLMPWLAVGLSVILVFLLLYGLVANGDWNAKWLKIVFGVLSGLFVIGVVIYAGGFWDNLRDFFSGGFGGEVWSNIILFVIIIAAVLVVTLSAKKS